MTLEDVLITFGRPDVLPILVLGLISVVLSQIPIIGWFFVPFRVINTLIHELSHVIAIRVTGGQFQRLEIYASGGGVTPFRGQINWFVVSAGYIGATLFGGFLILLTTSSIPARAVLMGLAIFLGVICLSFVGNLFGFVMSLAVSGLMFYAGWQLDNEGAASILLFLAVQMILASFRSLSHQIKASRQHPGGSDAEVMEQMTAIPALFWALLWCLMAVVVLAWSITTAYRDLPLP
jgi:Peptidase M50B-like